MTRKDYEAIARASIDHGVLSPSGHVSKRAREHALKREHDRLFPPGFWDKPISTPEQIAQSNKQGLLRSAQTLRELAAKGMKPRAYIRKAEELERQAKELT